MCLQHRNFTNSSECSYFCWFVEENGNFSQIRYLFIVPLRCFKLLAPFCLVVFLLFWFISGRICVISTVRWIIKDAVTTAICPSAKVLFENATKLDVVPYNGGLGKTRLVCTAQVRLMSTIIINILIMYCMHSATTSGVLAGNLLLS